MLTLDLYRTARILIDQHGDDAALEAAMKADHSLAAGNIDAANVWRGVVNAINDLASGGDGSETRH